MVTRPFTPALGILLAIALVLCGSGATCQRSMLVSPFGTPGPVAPEVLAEGATREQIIAAVNQNSGRIQSLRVTGASITIPDTLELPILSGNIAAQRPGRFRFTAGTVVTGPEIDLGCNDELFWMWARRNQPPGVYICRHDRFASSSIRQIMPVEPRWLLAAMGIVELEPTNVFEGPLPRGDGTVELRSWMASSTGPLQRVTVIDSRRAWVVEEHVYDQGGTTLLASAVAESHRYYPLEQVSLPDRLSIRLPPAGLAFKIDLGTVQINPLIGDQQQLWTLPTFAGYPQLDLGGSAAAAPLPATSSTQPSGSVMTTSYPAYPAGFGLVPAYATPAYSPASFEPPLYQAPGRADAGPHDGGSGYWPLPQYGRR